MLGDPWRHWGRLGLFTLLRKPRRADDDQTTHQDQLIPICVMLVAYPDCPKKQGPLGRIKFTSTSILCTPGELYPTAAHTPHTNQVTLLTYCFTVTMVGGIESRCWQGCAPSVTRGEAILAPPQHPLACSYIQSLLRQLLCLVQTCKSYKGINPLVLGPIQTYLDFLCKNPIFKWSLLHRFNVLFDWI